MMRLKRFMAADPAAMERDAGNLRYRLPSIRLLLRSPAAFLIAALLSLFAPSLASQPARPALSNVKVVAVAPFADDVGMQDWLARWAAVRLTELIPRPVFQVVPFDQAEHGLREMRITPAALIGLTPSAELGRRLGADAVITGRLTQADLEQVPLFLLPLPPAQRPEGPPEAFVTIDLRIVIVATRQVVLQTETAGYGIGLFPLQSAAEMALREFIRLMTGG